MIEITFLSKHIALYREGQGLMVITKEEAEWLVEKLTESFKTSPALERR